MRKSVYTRTNRQAKKEKKGVSSQNTRQPKAKAKLLPLVWNSHLDVLDNSDWQRNSPSKRAVLLIESIAS